MATGEPIDLGWKAKRGGLYMAGKVITHEIVHEAPVLQQTVTSFITPEITMGLSGAANVLGVTPAAVVTIGMLAGLSAGLTQLDYNRKITNLKDFDYAEELSAKLKKPVHDLTKADLYTLAKENRTLGDHIHKINKERNFGVFFSFAASLGSMAIVTLAMTALVTMPALASLAGHLHLFSGAWFAKAAMQGVMGLAAYHAIKAPLHWVGDKLFGLDEETAHERILSLKHDRERGKSISPEQILGVFTLAHPELDRFITTRYGSEFEKLSLIGKQLAVQELSTSIPLEQLARDINSGHVNVTELAFAAEGDMSGVYHVRTNSETHPHGLLGTIMAKFRGAFRHAPVVEPITVTAASSDYTMTYQEEQKPAQSFVQRLGLKPADTHIGYADRLDKSRNDSTPGLIQP